MIETKTVKPKKLRIYCDGGSRGNPGPAGIGVVVEDEQGRVVQKISKFIGHATNNEAEYAALIFGLEYASHQGVDDVEFRLDSELVVMQMTGRYKVRSVSLKPFYEEARRWLGKFKSARFTHVRRQFNKGADELVNQALDRHI